jgi:hypothetical protein
VESNVQIVEGEVTLLAPGEQFLPLATASLGQDFYQLLKLIMDMVNAIGLSDVLYGRSTGDSGYAISQLIAAARMKLKPIIVHGESGINEALSIISDIIEYQIKQKVYIFSGEGKQGWLSIGPDDLKGYRQFRCAVNPLLPTDTYAKSSQAINEVAAGIIDKNTARENIGYDQPDEIERRILVDKIKELPQVQNWLMQKALEKAGLDLGPSEDEIKASIPLMPMAAQGAMGGGAPQMGAPGMGAPPGPGTMPGPMGQGPGAGGVPGPAGPLGGEAPIPQGMTPPGELAPPMGMEGPGAGPQQDPVEVVMVALQQGTPPQEILQFLVEQLGLSQEQAVALIQEAMNRLASQGGGGGAGGPGGLQPEGPGFAPSNAVMAAPGVQAAPPPPPSGVAERPRPPRQGPQVRPQGIAGGREPGVRRGSVER